MDKKTQYLDHILSLYPDLTIREAWLNEDGQYNDGLIVNNDFIFRFPKVPIALAMIYTEYTILRDIQGHTTLPVPNPISSHLTTDVLGKAFIGYRLIPGEPLLRETFEEITDPAIQDRIIDQIGRFLKELHNIPVKEAISIPLPRRDTREVWTDIFLRFRDKLFPHLDPEYRDRVTNNFAMYLANLDQVDFKPVLRHGDFGTVNLLFDAAEQRISGVIDFGNAGLGDPALDFAALIAPFGYGEAIIERFARVYPLDEAMMDRARFYVSTYALQEALYGAERGSPKIFQSGLSGYHPPGVRW
jgi:aminoglycoside 2''-phosphotransferase